MSLNVVTFQDLHLRYKTPNALILVLDETYERKQHQAIQAQFPTIPPISNPLLPGQPLHHPLHQKHQTHRTRIRRQVIRIRNIRRPRLRLQLGSTHLACLSRISERGRFRKSGDEWDMGTHDGAVALARSGAPLWRGDGLNPRI